MRDGAHIDSRRRRGLVKGVAKAPDILEQDTETMISTNVTGLINMTQVRGPSKILSFLATPTNEVVPNSHHRYVMSRLTGLMI